MKNWIERFIIYLEQREEILAGYQEKIDQIKTSIERIESEIQENKDKIDRDAERIQQMVDDLERGDQGYLENLLKALLGVQDLLEKKQDYIDNLIVLNSLKEKALMVKSGIEQLNHVDEMESNSYHQLNVMTRQALFHLGFLEGKALFFADLPFALKKIVNIKFFGQQERFDDLFSWRRQKEIVLEKAPEGVLYLTKMVKVMNKARSRIIESLRDDTGKSIADWDFWRVETLMVHRAHLYLTEATTIFYEKLFPRDKTAHLISSNHQSLIEGKAQLELAVSRVSDEDKRLLSRF
jgi:hypothetical protein